jgi:hypothetical protein
MATAEPARVRRGIESEGREGEGARMEENEDE